MNNFKISYRNFFKHKPYSFLNLLGLSIGLSITFIVSLYILEEVGYDTQHKDYQNVYRLISKDSTRQQFTSWTNPQIPKLLKEQIPEIVETASYTGSNFSIKNALVNEGFYYADQSITDIFTFNFVEGDIASFQNDPYVIIVSESFAKTHFKEVPVVGQTIEMGRGETIATYTVGAIFKDFYRKSTFRPNLILQNRSSESYRSYLEPAQLGSRSYQSYLKVGKQTNIATLTKKINSVYKNLPNSFQYTYLLQPLNKVHLYSEGIAGQTESGSIKKVWIFGIIGAFILIMSLTNFLLLYTSITKQRFKEFAIRQVNGLTNTGLLKMFIVESLLISIISAFLAFLVMLFIIPIFNDYTNSNLQFQWNENYTFLLYATLLILLISLLSGFYFYKFIQKQNSADVLYRNRSVKSSNFFLGNGAVVIQLIIVCVMLVFSIGYYKQLNFMMDSGKGFNADNLLMLQRRNWDASVFENELLKHPEIEIISRGQVLPLSGSSQIYDISLNEDPSSIVPMELMRVDYNYIPLYQIKLVQGRNFSEDYAVDKSGRSLIINESALKMLNLENPIGAETSEGTVIGVVEDFKFESFHKTLRPLFFRMPETIENAEFNNMITKYGDLMIKYKAGEREKAIETVTTLLEDLKMSVISDYSEISNIKNRDQPFVVFNQNYYGALMEKVYGEEKTLQKVILCLTAISILITMFGLIGMSLYNASRKTKEIGIRKVNGASTKEILILLNKNFTKWTLIAFILAIPISYYVLGRWLEGFAYKTELNWWIFILSALLILLIALLSVSFQSYRAAQENPAKTLKNE